MTDPSQYELFSAFRVVSVVNVGEVKVGFDRKYITSGVCVQRKSTLLLSAGLSDVISYQGKVEKGE